MGFFAAATYDNERLLVQSFLATGFILQTFRYLLLLIYYLLYFQWIYIGKIQI